jgi:hypothetical protein
MKCQHGGLTELQAEGRRRYGNLIDSLNWRTHLTSWKSENILLQTTKHKLTHTVVCYTWILLAHMCKGDCKVWIKPRQSLRVVEIRARYFPNTSQYRDNFNLLRQKMHKREFCTRMYQNADNYCTSAGLRPLHVIRKKIQPKLGTRFWPAGMIRCVEGNLTF